MGTSIDSEYARLRFKICHVKARIAGNSSTPSSYCEDLQRRDGEFGLKMLIHELIEVPKSQLMNFLWP